MISFRPTRDADRIKLSVRMLDKDMTISMWSYVFDLDEEYCGLNVPEGIENTDWSSMEESKRIRLAKCLEIIT
jgi:hypothetical protein